MTKRILTILAALALGAMSLAAKGRTVKITITGGGLSTPVEVAGDAVGQFHIWAGPGVEVNGVPETEGFIGDWKRGPIERPAHGLRRYEVSFYVGCSVRIEGSGCKSEIPKLAYVVSYAYDPSTGRGFVYIPGKGDPWVALNSGSIFRDVERNWFHTTSEWDKFARPFIARP